MPGQPMTDRRIATTTIGRSGYQLTLIDNAHDDPADLCTSLRTAQFSRWPDDYYPGLRAPSPPGYAEWLASLLSAAQPHAGRHVSIERTTAAVACDNPAALAPIQLVPHFDSLDPALFAAVHYLCDARFGGTGFFRHRRTNIEQVTARNIRDWQLGSHRTDYIADGDSHFDQIAVAPLQFNRLIVYPANSLHSGMLSGHTLSADPHLGRLTITSLVRYL